MSSSLSSRGNTVIHPLPTNSGITHKCGGFRSFAESLDYAAKGKTGFNIYSGKGVLLEKLSYHKLREQSRKIAQAFLNKGLKKGDRVAIVAESDGDFARMFFACQYAGLIAAPMPLPLAFGGKEAYIETLHGMIETAQAQAVIIPDIIGRWSEAIIGDKEFLFAGSPAQIMEEMAEPKDLPQIDEDAISYLQFSSGSTRFPMGVSITHRSGMANVTAIARDGLKIRGNTDRCVSWLPLYHDMGLVGFFLTPITCQMTVDILPTRDFARRPHVWLALINANRGTIAYSPSFGYELCARRSPASDLDLSCWRVAGIGGDMIRAKILEDFSKHFSAVGFNPKAFVASYGMAETTLGVSFPPLDTGIRTDTIDLVKMEEEDIAAPATDSSPSKRTFVLCGHVLEGHKLEVRDAQGNPLPERKIGTIYVSGPSLMKGYYRKPEETKKVLSSDGWLNTGDLGYLLNGEIVVTGRAKDLIIANGRNIWPQDLEWAAEHHFSYLRSHDVAVFSFEQNDKEKIVALVQCRLTDPEKREELRKEAKSLFRRMHGVEVDVELVRPHSLPKTSSGKLSRTKARKMFLNHEFEGATP